MSEYIEYKIENCCNYGKPLEVDIKDNEIVVITCPDEDYDGFGYCNLNREQAKQLVEILNNFINNK